MDLPAGPTLSSNHPDSQWSDQEKGAGQSTRRESVHPPRADPVLCYAEEPPLVNVHALDSDALSKPFKLCPTGLSLYTSPNQPIYQLVPGQRSWFTCPVAVTIPKGYIGVVSHNCTLFGLDPRLAAVEPSFISSNTATPVRVLVRNAGVDNFYIGPQMHIAQMTIAKLELDAAFSVHPFVEP